jgi:hypothetical protein
MENETSYIFMVFDGLCFIPLSIQKHFINLIQFIKRHHILRFSLMRYKKKLLKLMKIIYYLLYIENEHEKSKC